MPAARRTYTFLGPEGTFTEAALLQVPDAAEAVRIPSSNVNAALDRVRDGSADAAMVPIENSVEGGVTATLDAIATGQELRIIREALVPISFVLVARPGVELAGSAGSPLTGTPGRNAGSGWTSIFPALNTFPVPLRPLLRWACWRTTRTMTRRSVRP